MTTNGAPDLSAAIDRLTDPKSPSVLGLDDYLVENGFQRIDQRVTPEDIDAIRIVLEAARRDLARGSGPASGCDLLGKRVAWEHGTSTVAGKATRYDEGKDELHLEVDDGLTYAHLWVPAAGCRLMEDS